LHRRKFPRKSVRTDVSYYYQNPRMTRVYSGTGKTVNISMNGALIRIENYLPPRSEIDLYIRTKDGSRVYARSLVVHCHRVAFNTYEIGVQFLKVEKRPKKVPRS